MTRIKHPNPLFKRGIHLFYFTLNITIVMWLQFYFSAWNKVHDTTVLCLSSIKKKTTRNIYVYINNVYIQAEIYTLYINKYTYGKAPLAAQGRGDRWGMPPISPRWRHWAHWSLYQSAGCEAPEQQWRRKAGFKTPRGGETEEVHFQIKRGLMLLFFTFFSVIQKCNI